MVIIREFNNEDLEDVKLFALLAQKRESTYNPNLKTDEEAYNFLHAWLRESISTGGKIFVAEEQGENVGFAWGWIIRKPSELYKVERIGYIYQVYVKEEKKREIREKLLSELIRYFKEKRIKHVIADCYANDLETIKLYEKFGFRPQALTLMRRLKNDGEEATSGNVRPL
ncbi:MAG: hypothetical protein DRJ18_02135 [Candidatus Methanomethylicota archaeon]|nr:GNAT family N-acetyltransferase [Candidatus Culexmicrobium cathedralense]RLE48397.1 MAG: hypothetical protein DRJ18_02135 [Candidatus Verstraetearchaeota archaeon]